MESHSVRIHWMYQYCVLYLAWWWFSEPKRIAVIINFNIDYHYMLCYWLNKLLYYPSWLERISTSPVTVREACRTTCISGTDSAFARGSREKPRKILMEMAGRWNLAVAYWPLASTSAFMFTNTNGSPFLCSAHFALRRKHPPLQL